MVPSNVVWTVAPSTGFPSSSLTVAETVTVSPAVTSALERDPVTSRGVISTTVHVEKCVVLVTRYPSASM